MPTEFERRIISAPVSFRASDGEGGESGSPGTASGHAALFNSRSENLGGFVEEIAPGAFDDVLGDDVRALFNHNPDHILGRTASETLSIGVDDDGLRYDVTLPDTSAGRDLAVSLERGDVSQSSFGFTVADDDWTEEDSGLILRTITKFNRLYDVSPVTFAAYPETQVGLRSMSQFLASKRTSIDAQLERLKLRLRIIEIEGRAPTPTGRRAA